MENFNESKQIISEAKNIYLIPSNEPEAITATLALFYTLKELGKNVNLVIEKLPEKQKMALTLRVFDELPFKEIAEIMECPYDTAKANFRHAINSLRKHAKLLKTLMLY